MTAVSDLKEGDPVHVNRDAGQLEGVVAFLGTVDFADGDDWVGVRLTGKSTGNGKNDGSVKGKRYFSTPENCGMFVRVSSISKRTLSRLEELRLRRELNSATAPTSAGPSSATRASGIPSIKSPKVATSASSISTPARATTIASSTPSEVDTTATTPGSSTAAKNKLEELRKRRAQLKEKRQDLSDSGHSATAHMANSAIPSSTTSSFAASKERTSTASLASFATNDDEIKRLQDQIQDLLNKLNEKEERTNELEKRLEQSQKDSDEAKSKIRELENSLEEAKATKSDAPSPSKLAASYELPDEVQEQIMMLENKSLDLEDKLEQTLQDLTNLRKDFDQERKGKLLALDEATKARSEATSYHNQLQALTDQSTARGQADASHYKERAKLLAEISNFKRKIEQLEKEKVELEATIEDVTLDKEQLQEEKESLEDRWEELRLDCETAQMEVEELKMELEDARASAERMQAASSTIARTGSSASAGTTESAVGSEAETHQMQQETTEMVEALQVQNARLREALIRLREQSAVEKMEVTRQLRAAEKDAEAANELQKEVEQKTEVVANLEEQISDLKDMVEQGAAFEGMVEDLSDRLLSLEEDHVMLQAVLREMEEAAELTAEMEEVQADEIKALTHDLEGRDVIIRNLEEAIKIQRRREDDFRRTVGNYKMTVETLKQEKRALLELQEGGKGEKSNLIAASQKALAKAAQLVADAAALRKREAQAALDQIDRQIFQHLATRFETLLPQSVVAAEVGAIKGEMLVAKVISKASKSLEGIGSSFTKTIRPALPQDDDGQEDTSTTGSSQIKMSDEVSQQISTMIHQTEFAHLLVEASADLLRLLSAGQWPDMMTPESSTELGNILGHSVPELDNMLQMVLKTFKEEGALTVEQSNIGALKLTLQNTMQTLKSEIQREDGVIVPSDWNPPGWQLLKNASLIKFSCQGAAAALSLAVNQSDSLESISPALASLYNRVEQSSSQAANACLRLASLDVKNEKLVSDLTPMINELKQESQKMLVAVKEMLTSDVGIERSSSASETTLRTLAKLLASLRGAKMKANKEEAYHRLSPEVGDAWESISTMARNVRSIDGDSDDINHLIRIHRIESRLRDAVEKEPKLAIANQKVSSLEKSLSSRSKEIAMQNARLSELEKMVAKSSSALFGRGKTADLKSSEEYNNLKEENRVLTEAMEVLQREVEMYENEVRLLKDQKTPKRGGASRGTPIRRALTSISDLTPNPRGPVPEDLQASTGILEATLFRPALQQALREAARWKAATTGASILELPPLPMVARVSVGQEEKEGDDMVISEDFIRLSSAINACRLQKASMTLIDLTNREKSPRDQFQEMTAKSLALSEQLETTMLRCRGRALI